MTDFRILAEVLAKKALSAPSIAQTFNRLPLNVVSHMVSRKHTCRHRIAYGFSVGLVGVVISASCGHIEFEVVRVAGDYVGYALHGLGCVPIVDHLIEVARLRDND